MRNLWGRGRAPGNPWRPLSISLAVAIAFVVAGGASYRLAMGRLQPHVSEPILLPVPLSSFPEKIDVWNGVDIPVDPAVLRIAGNDDYLHRSYTRGTGPTTERAYLYIGYSARPRTMLHHSPEICYVNAGWLHDITEPVEVELTGGSVLESNIYSFDQQPPAHGSIFVLNYYVLNGRRTRDASDFRGLGWRLPNLAGDPAWYVAQVQVISVSRHTAIRLAAATADTILEYLPDEAGIVQAADAGGLRYRRTDGE